MSTNDPMNRSLNRSAAHQSASRRSVGSGDGASGRSAAGASPPRQGSSWKRHGTAMPSWTDLEPQTNSRRRETGDDDGSFLQGVSTVRFGLLILALAAVFTLYVGHVHATQQLLMDVQEARATNHTLHLKHNRLKGDFDRATGPSVIYERARELGLRESVTYGPSIRIDE